MEQNLDQVQAQALNEIESANDLESLTNVKNTYLSKKSPLMALMSKMRDLVGEEKALFGQKINSIKNLLTEKIEEKKVVLETKALNSQLEKEVIDITLPGKNYERGGKNPIKIIEDEMVDIFTSMGYEIAEGPEVEQDHYNFELLNIPQDHPARDMQDSFYIDERTLMRTHTSPVQARTMEVKNGKPIKVICPGKVYRRDDDDATHSHQFGQIEGLLVDKDINLGHLKATLELFLRKMYGDKREIRMRSSYFPFTEPSVEVDISCYECGGKGCPVCKGSGWIEILGGGMVHPNVLKMSGYDPKVYQGFAFGIGIERVAMLRYGIDDIRRIYQNDLRVLKQFQKK
ncbi:MAG: phenylalanine--tRNA ligase subunit alpha [Bacilli bacterium]|nr:phenylalanine--tRNA ligase subunit alpha [Bacilli bacterium]